MSKKTLKFLLLLLITVGLTWPYSFKTGDLPPIGKFFSPFEGFWQQAEKSDINLPRNLKFAELHDAAEVVYDDRLVHHIFASNDHDLYFLQGYVTASHRLFQMDLQTRAAGGRLSEIVGEKALKLDMEARRIGLKYGAEKAIDYVMKDSVLKVIVQSYSDGINAFINQLTYSSLPLEYKLLDFKPEAWAPIKTALLLKYMANTLTGYETDFEYTNAVKLLGYDTFISLFPEYPDTLLDPIIPKGTPFPTADDSILPKISFRPGDHDVAVTYPFEKPASEFGSNNWAVSGSRTASGKPILCNDPHLSLNLPSIWYEIQLHSPQSNVYGASLPGSPCVIIGFNDSIAWGTTNAAMDVKDWYNIEFKDSKKDEYLFDGKWKKTEKVIEEFIIRGSDPVYDTIINTLHGPVAFDEKYNSGQETVNRALKWTAHEASKELMTFYLLNKADNYADYDEAMKFYQCPGQNFVFASAGGDIAMRQQGKFVHKAHEQGRFIMDGSIKETLWVGFIPDSANPQALNPEQGWLSSANQHPTDESYPYYYSGTYEYFRNRRINKRLSEIENAKIEDMMRLQNDNFNLYASEILPLMLEALNPNEIKSNEQTPLNLLKQWIFFNDPEEKAPVYFEEWWKLLNESIWDEFKDQDRRLVMPGYFETIRYIKRFPDGVLIDDRRTPETESLKDLINLTFHNAIEKVDDWKKDHESLSWANYKSTSITHLTRLPAFSIKNIQNGGNKSIVNATSENKGPGWRMVVSPGDAGQAFGVYPGGQSGNPGSVYYDNFIDSWTKGSYYTLLLLKPHEQHQRILHITSCSP